MAQKSEQPREAKAPEKMTKSALLDSLGRKLSKDELVSLHKAVAGGFRPYTSADLATGMVTSVVFARSAQEAEAQGRTAGLAPTHVPEGSRDAQ